MTALSPLAAAALGSLEAALASAAAASEPGFYEDLRDNFAKDIVAEFNTGAVVLIKPSKVQGANPLKAFAGLSRRTPRNAIVTGYTRADSPEQEIVAGDRRVLIDAADFTTGTAPESDDQVEIDGRVHMLVSLKAVPEAGPAVIYIMQARR